VSHSDQRSTTVSRLVALRRTPLLRVASLALLYVVIVYLFTIMFRAQEPSLRAAVPLSRPPTHGAMHMYAIVGQEPFSAVGGRLTYDHQTDRLDLEVYNLPIITSNPLFELWVNGRGGRERRLGLFQRATDGHGQLVLRHQDLRGDTTAVLTIAQGRGTKTPARPIVASATIQN